MESQPQNPEFRYNPEVRSRSSSHFLLTKIMKTSGEQKVR